MTRIDAQPPVIAPAVILLVCCVAVGFVELAYLREGLFIRFVELIALIFGGPFAVPYFIVLMIVLIGIPIYLLWLAFALSFVLLGFGLMNYVAMLPLLSRYGRLKNVPPRIGSLIFAGFGAATTLILSLIITRKGQAAFVYALDPLIGAVLGAALFWVNRFTETWRPRPLTKPA